MIILRDSSVVPPACYGAVAALGNFDGLHLGHKEVINKAVTLARITRKPAMLLTFEPNPRKLFKPDLPILRILPFAEKARQLQKMGIDFLRIIRFTRAFSQTTAEAFITDILKAQLQVSQVVTGDDFVFGYNREGNADYLQHMAEKYDFKATACAPVQAGGERCSSTLIRALLSAGEVAQAATLLGRPYSMKGRVQQGDKRGRELGFPTANIYLAPIFLAANGVYVVRAHIHGKEVEGVANLGLRPTFGGSRIRLEVHLFDWQENIYGESLEVTFIKRLRGEYTFNGLEELKTQIAKDCEQAKIVLAGS
jgi:riboflavin kinase/FMN adenylyltransferase